MDVINFLEVGQVTQTRHDLVSRGYVNVILGSSISSSPRGGCESCIKRFQDTRWTGGRRSAARTSCGGESDQTGTPAPLQGAVNGSGNLCKRSAAVEVRPWKDKFDVQRDGEAGWRWEVGSDFYSVHPLSALHLGLNMILFLHKHYLLTGGRE